MEPPESPRRREVAGPGGRVEQKQCTENPRPERVPLSTARWHVQPVFLTDVGPVALEKPSRQAHPNFWKSGSTRGRGCRPDTGRRKGLMPREGRGWEEPLQHPWPAWSRGQNLTSGPLAHHGESPVSEPAPACDIAPGDAYDRQGNRRVAQQPTQRSGVPLCVGCPCCKVDSFHLPRG